MSVLNGQDHNLASHRRVVSDLERPCTANVRLCMAMFYLDQNGRTRPSWTPFWGAELSVAQTFHIPRVYSSTLNILLIDRSLTDQNDDAHLVVANQNFAVKYYSQVPVTDGVDK